MQILVPTIFTRRLKGGDGGNSLTQNHQKDVRAKRYRRHLSLSLLIDMALLWYISPPCTHRPSILSHSSSPCLIAHTNYRHGLIACDLSLSLPSLPASHRKWPLSLSLSNVPHRLIYIAHSSSSILYFVMFLLKFLPKCSYISLHSELTLIFMMKTRNTWFSRKL